MNSSINLTSQRISFVNKISILQKALSNDETPTPSYLYKEINDISYESIGYCESLVEYLIDRLRHQSCHVKLKVLKVMKHVLENGSQEFQLGLKQHVSFVKECTKFSGPPHPVHGNTPYVMVRNVAVELCEKLYGMDPLSLKSAGKSLEDVQAPQAKYGGMGPSRSGGAIQGSRSGGAIQGFGNSPMTQSKGFAGTILHEIEKLGTRLSETPVDRQAAVLARLNLSGSSSNYQPPVVVSPDMSEAFNHHHQSREESPSLSVDSRVEKPANRHFPGKAGGGWNDDDDEDGDDLGKVDVTDGLSDEDGESSLQGSPELRESAERQDSKEFTSEEKILVEDMVITQSPTFSNHTMGYLSNSDIADFLRRCSKLKCAIVLDCIFFKLVEEDPLLLGKSLQLLEGIVYSRQELINIDQLVVRCKAALVDCFVKAGKEAETFADVDGTSGDFVMKWKSVQIKSAKLILILQQLSSQKEIFPNRQIAMELSKSTSSITSPI